MKHGTCYCGLAGHDPKQDFRNVGITSAVIIIVLGLGIYWMNYSKSDSA
jgi:hypothetical protein